MKIFTWKNEENVSYCSPFYSLKKIWTWNRTSLTQNRNQSMYTCGLMLREGGLIWGGAYTWSNTGVKDKVVYLRGSYSGAKRQRYTVYFCCTEHPPLYSWYPLDVLMIFLQCSQHRLVYSRYASDIHQVSPLCTEHSPMYCTSPGVLKTNYA